MSLHAYPGFGLMGLLGGMPAGVGGLMNLPMLQFLTQLQSQPGGPPAGFDFLRVMGGFPMMLPQVTLPHTFGGSRIAQDAPISEAPMEVGGGQRRFTITEQR